METDKGFLIENFELFSTTFDTEDQAVNASPYKDNFIKWFSHEIVKVGDISDLIKPISVEAHFAVIVKLSSGKYAWVPKLEEDKKIIKELQKRKEKSATAKQFLANISSQSRINTLEFLDAYIYSNPIWQESILWFISRTGEVMELTEQEAELMFAISLRSHVSDEKSVSTVLTEIETKLNNYHSTESKNE